MRVREIWYDDKYECVYEYKRGPLHVKVDQSTTTNKIRW